MLIHVYVFVSVKRVTYIYTHTRYFSLQAIKDACLRKSRVDLQLILLEIISALTETRMNIYKHVALT